MLSNGKRNALFLLMPLPFITDERTFTAKQTYVYHAMNIITFPLYSSLPLLYNLYPPRFTYNAQAANTSR